MPRARTHSNAAVLAATQRVLAALGPARLTLAAVAREAGLAAPTLVQRFGSKRGLLLALAAQAAPSLEQSFSATDTQSALGALNSALTTMVAEIASPDEMANHVAALHLDLSDPDFKAHAVAHARAFRSGVQRLLDRAVAAGELRPIDTRRLAEAVQVTYNGSLVSWAIDPRGSLAERLVDELSFLLAPYRTQA